MSVILFLGRIKRYQSTKLYPVIDAEEEEGKKNRKTPLAEQHGVSIRRFYKKESNMAAS